MEWRENSVLVKFESIVQINFYSLKETRKWKKRKQKNRKATFEYEIYSTFNAIVMQFKRKMFKVKNTSLQQFYWIKIKL